MWQEWMLGVCLVSWTKVESLEFTVDSYTCVRHAGTVHPVKDTWGSGRTVLFRILCIGRFFVPWMGVHRFESVN